LYGKSNKKNKPRPRIICPIEDPENDIKSVDDKNAEKLLVTSLSLK
jgi:hypothetical protein